jgi:hypothetical protein
LDDAASGLMLDEFDPRTHTGYVPAKLAGDSTGFELFSGAVSQLSSIDLSTLSGRDRYLEFVTHSDFSELKAASLAAAAVAKLADGIYFDGTEFRKIDHVLMLVRESESEMKAWKRRRAEKDAAITSSRCPHCGAPCPSYRKTCKACGKAVGGTSGVA